MLSEKKSVCCLPRNVSARACSSGVWEWAKASAEVITLTGAPRAGMKSVCDSNAGRN